MRRAGETVTNTQTPESIAEREFIVFWRERAAQQNIEIRNSLMPTNTSTNVQETSTPSFQQNLENIERNMTDTRAEQALGRDHLVDLHATLNSLEQARGWSRFWLGIHEWWHGGLFNSLMMGGALVGVFAGGFLLYRYMRRDNRLSVRVTEGALSWLRNRRN
jgi:hypothetical protein